MPGHIGLRRLIQQSAYLSDSLAGRRITADFRARFRLPNGKKYRNPFSTGGYASSWGLARLRGKPRGLRSQDGQNPAHWRCEGKFQMNARPCAASIGLHRWAPPRRAGGLARPAAPAGSGARCSNCASAARSVRCACAGAPGVWAWAGTVIAKYIIVLAAPAPAAHLAPRGQLFAELPATVHQPQQADHDRGAGELAGIWINCLSFSNQREAGDLASRIELDAQQLERAVILAAVDQADREGHH